MTKREFLDTVFAIAPNEANKIMDAFDEYVERGDGMSKIFGIALIVLSAVLMIWGLGNGNEFDEYK